MPTKAELKAEIEIHLEIIGQLETKVKDLKADKKELRDDKKELKDENLVLEAALMGNPTDMFYDDRLLDQKKVKKLRDKIKKLREKLKNAQNTTD